MKNICIFLCVVVSVATLGCTPSANERQRYQIVDSDQTILVDTYTGKTWSLVSTNISSEPYWHPIKVLNTIPKRYYYDPTDKKIKDPNTTYEPQEENSFDIIKRFFLSTSGQGKQAVRSLPQGLTLEADEWEDIGKDHIAP